MRGRTADMVRIPFEGCDSFRDLGGNPTTRKGIIRRGMIYRSGRLSALSENDVVKIQTLGICTVIDLRTEQEIREHPDILPKDNSCRAVHLPLSEIGLGKKQVVEVFQKAIQNKLDTHEHMISDYWKFPFEFAAGVQPVFSQLLEEASYPVLIHCTAGKDRTGFISALLLGMLGCSDETIIRDYLSYQRRDLKASAQRYAASFAEYGLNVPIHMTYPYLTVSREYIQSLLESIYQHWGAVSHYLEQKAHVTKAMQRRLGDLLVHA